MALDHMNKANAEAAKQIKRHAAALLDVDTACEEENRARLEIEDQVGIADRKGNEPAMSSCRPGRKEESRPPLNERVVPLPPSARPASKRCLKKERKGKGGGVKRGLCAESISCRRGLVRVRRTHRRKQPARLLLSPQTKADFIYIANVLMSELEEARLLLDTAERARRNIEGEIADTRDAIGNLTNANAMLAVDKRRLDGDIRGAQAELDNLMLQVKNAEEKARKACVDAGKHLIQLKSEMLSIH